MRIQRLSDEELDVMLMVWHANSVVTKEYIQKALVEKRRWEMPKLLSVLSRLVDKGFLKPLAHERSGGYVFAVSQRDYQAHERKNLLERMLGQRVKSMITLPAEKRLGCSGHWAPGRRYGFIIKNGDKVV